MSSDDHLDRTRQILFREKVVIIGLFGKKSFLETAVKGDLLRLPHFYVSLLLDQNVKFPECTIVSIFFKNFGQA